MADTEKDPLESFMERARKQFTAAATDEAPLREEAKRDLRYVAGDQWDEDIKRARKAKNRPALTFNRCHTFVQQVSNEARQNKPQIKFAPGEGGDRETAEIYEGLARHIQYSSDAQVAYETAVEYQAGGSFGYYRFATDYCDDQSFDQELKIVPVLDPFAIYGVLFPSCFGMEPKFAFVIEDMPKDEFKTQFGDTKMAEMGWEAADKAAPGWVGTDTVRIAEYWYVEETPVEIERGGKKRTLIRRKVKFCKINGIDKLPGTETEWLGSCIPIIPVPGKQIIRDGKPELFSVVRQQRGAQDLINIYKTSIAENLMTRPIQPYMVPKGAIPVEDYAKWEGMNQDLRPFLEYNVVDVQGRPVPPPVRNTFEPPIAGLSAAAAQEIDDMKATAGIYDASMGAKSNETSGLAIARRQQQANITNLHFMDNLERSFKKGGKVLEELIPIIYDGPRMQQILGHDEAPKLVRINEAYRDDSGQQKHYRLNQGKYHVVVTMGKAFSTKRMESFDLIGQVIQAAPNLLPMIGDIYFANSDVAGGDQLAERFKKMLPPNLQDDDKGDPKAQLAAMQAQMAQAQQNLQALDAFAKQLQQEKETKAVEMQAKVAIERDKAQIQYLLEMAKLENARAIAEINAKAQDARERLKLQIDLDHKQHVAAHEVGINAMNQAHDRDMAERGHEQTLEQQEQAGQRALVQAQQQAELNPPQAGQ